MSLIKAKTNTSSLDWKQFILPAYIIFSLIFIAFTLYLYFRGAVYNAWFTTGQQQGYALAFNEVITRAREACEAISLSSGENKIDIVNVACLEQAQNTNPISPEGE